MINRYDHKGLVWIDLEAPTNDEARQIMEEFQIDPLVAEELLTPSVKPKVETYPDFIYLILHFPAFKHTHKAEHNQEIDFIVGKHFLITARYDTIDPLHKFAKVFEVHSILAKEQGVEHGGTLLYHMLRKLYHAVEHELDFIRDELSDIERNIFEGREREMVISLSEVSRALLNFKQAMAMHRTILESFDKASSHFFSEDFSYHVRTVIGQYQRIQNDILSNLDTLDELRETNNSLLTIKQNEITKTLTIMAFTTFPLTLTAAIFSMYTKNTPLVGNPFDFWIVLGIMLLTSTTFFAYFKHRGWL